MTVRLSAAAPCGSDLPKWGSTADPRAGRIGFPIHECVGHVADAERLLARGTPAKNFTSSPDTKDRVGHGTHVASTAAPWATAQSIPAMAPESSNRISPLLVWAPPPPSSRPAPNRPCAPQPPWTAKSSRTT
ncbi:hypothetical protein ACFRMN_21955 [Streptomyces sp. NPDC056835]|uniref:hypothetical protein n=1 Tax=Streptomyces sp. NPDC056835 TaxID=3345956 RepID=UPI0036B12897